MRVILTTDRRVREDNTGSQKEWPSDTGAPSIDQAVINSGLSLITPGWDFTMAESKEHLKVYQQALLAGIKEAIV